MERGSQQSTSCLFFIFQTKGLGPPSRVRDISSISSYRVPLTAGLVPGYWQQPLKSLGPSCMPSLGLRMDNHTTQIVVGLHLGTPLCQPHICHHCGGHVDALATHGLSCIKSQGHFSRYASINAIIHRSLAAVNVPSTLEPTGLCRSDVK